MSCHPNLVHIKHKLQLLKIESLLNSNNKLAIIYISFFFFKNFKY